MPDKKTTETTRSDAANADANPVTDALDDAPAEVEDSTDEGAQGRQGSDDAGDAGGEAAPPEELKVVVSIKGGRATIGVQEPSSDPHIESFDDPELSGLTQEVLAVTERARARWEDAPKHPAHQRPAPPARRRSRRRQGSAQASTAEGEAAQAQQQMPRLF